jgi:hypothetical protein
VKVGEAVGGTVSAHSKYNPAGQSLQVSTFAAAEYLPATHIVQVLAPERIPLLVFEPGKHCSHASMLDCFEYLPGLHFVQSLAPVSDPVFVIDPGSQTLQDVLGG